MARPTKKHEVSRLNLEMPVEVRSRLEEIKDRTRADSLAEVIKRALSLYGYVMDEKQTGHKLFLRGPEGDREIIVL